MASVFLYVVLLWGIVQACPSEDWDLYDGNCYRYYPTDSQTWIQSELVCSNQGAHLVSVTSAEEAFYIHSQMIANSPAPDLDNYWIGLLRQGSGNNFAWMDGSPYDYQRWAPGEPSNDIADCGAALGDEAFYEPSYWNDAFCTSVYSFACKVPQVNWKTETDGTVKEYPSLSSLLKVGGQTSEDSRSSGGLSTGATAGIVLGGLVAFVCVGTIVFMMIYRRKKMVRPAPPVISGDMADNHI